MGRSDSWFRVRVVSADKVLLASLIRPPHPKYITRKTVSNGRKGSLVSSSELLAIDFRIPADQSELAQHIGIDERCLALVIQPDKKKSFFRKHHIEKRGKHHRGEYRIVWEAEPLLADAYKSFARRFDFFVRAVESRFPHASAYGYVRVRPESSCGNTIAGDSSEHKPDTRQSDEGAGGSVEVFVVLG